MTRGRYEIEFQGSNDGSNWAAYPFRYKPQTLNKAPGIYAPYQPRFEWNLWFASLGDWRQNDMVPLTEERLLTNEADVLALFQSNPFPQAPPRFARAVLWQYWFTIHGRKTPHRQLVASGSGSACMRRRLRLHLTAGRKSSNGPTNYRRIIDRKGTQREASHRNWFGPQRPCRRYRHGAGRAVG